DLPPERVLHALAGLEAQGLVGPVRAGAPERLAFEAGLPAGDAPPPVAIVDATGAGGTTGAGGASGTTGAGGAGGKTEAGGEAGRAVVAALRAAGFEPGDDDAPGALRVVVADDYLDPACVALAQAAWRAGRACFLIKPGGLRPLLGPYFEGAPGEPCPTCLVDTLREQRPVERVLRQGGEGDERDGGRPTAPRAELEASLAAAANLAAIKLRALVARPAAEAPATRLWALDFPRFELSEHRVRRRPQCPACGDATLQAALGERPVSLASAPIGFDADGGFRREAPAESYARRSHLVSPLLGPVTHLRPMPGRRAGAQPVYSSGYLVAPQRRVDANRFDRNCAGKGCTEDQARMSALAEAIERFSGTYRGDEAARLATLAELGAEALAPDALHLFSAAQAARGEAPPALPPGATIAWTPAWSLRDGRRRWAPLAYCYAESPAALGAGYCAPSSNGSAAGGCLEEAILQGLFEAVERDAVAVWWYGRVRRPEARVPAAAAYLEERRAGYAALGWTLTALDLTHDVGLPVVAAVALHEGDDRLALGFGAHHDAGLALRRAVCELDQVFDARAGASSPWRDLAASTLEHLRPCPDAPRAAALAPLASRDLKDHVEAWVRRLGELGLETFVVDKTRPDLGLHVAQTIVPGLRHPWPRFAPGRLYEVPVALGWAPRALGEGELNPHPLLI
ncbi:MAG TPA: TOMM precursor leader peptide-binding protein, partial [Polyangiaceae bacterium]|nr:TOMM precursor leader peptide-binding protein [Polyangiaceae bacterium]